MRKLIRYFIRYDVNANILIMLIFIFGLFGLASLKTTFFPNIESRNTTIQLIFPGASPEEIEEGVVLKIENNLKGLSGIDRIRSTSNENSAIINVEVLKGYDGNNVLQDIKNAIDRINSFPVGMEKPIVFKTEGREFAVSLALSGNADLKTLKQAARKVESDLLSMDGISKISIAGFPDEEIEFTFREQDMQAYQLTFGQVKRAIQQSNLNMTGGTIKGKDEELLIRARSKKYFAKDLQNIVLKTTADGRIVRVRDVADVIDTWADSPNRTYLDGQRTVLITVSNTTQEDLLTVSRQVNEYLGTFNETGNNVKLTIVRDGADLLNQRIRLLEKNGLIGAFLVLTFLSLFLNPRLGFWVALGLPVSFMGMFIAASIAGVTINMMSLFGMILVVGILVDDGIVIGENIYQAHEDGEKPVKAAINGTMNVLPAVFAGVATTAVAFSIFFFLDGLIGEFMSDMAFVVIMTLTFSLIESAFILPAHIAHSSSMKIGAKKSRIEKKINGFMLWMREKLYRPVLESSIRNKAVSFSIATGLMILTFGAIKGGIIKTTFFPYIDRDNISVTLEMGSGTPADVTEEKLNLIEQAIISVDHELSNDRQDNKNIVKHIQKQIGPKTHQGNINITLLGGEDRGMESYKITNAIRDRVGQIPGAELLSFGQGGHFGKAVSISLISENFSDLKAAKNDLKNDLTELTSLKNVADNNLEGLKEINISLKDKAYLLGISLQDVITTVREGFFGSEVQRLQRGLDEVRMWVRYDRSERASIGKLENMRIRMLDGREFPLREIAEFSIERGVLGIDHIDGKRQILVTADMKNPKESVTDVLAGIRSEIIPGLLKKYPGVHIGFEGQSKSTEKTAQSAKTVVPIIMIVMFVIIVATFRSFTQAMIVIAMIPLGFIGVGIGHFVHGIPISIMSMFGIIALVGIMVNDSLVMISAMNQTLKTGVPFREAVVQAGISRFRPIVLTSVTTVAGLAPIVLETSLQAQFLIPMAISVAYGLLVATFINLLILPASIIILNDIRYYTARIFTSKNLTRELVEPAVREVRFENE